MATISAKLLQKSSLRQLHVPTSGCTHRMRSSCGFLGDRNSTTLAHRRRMTYACAHTVQWCAVAPEASQYPPAHVSVRLWAACVHHQSQCSRNACVCVRDAWRSCGGLLLVPMLTRRGCVRVCRSSYCLRLFGRLALLALTFLAVLLPFRAIIVCGGLELPAFLAFQNSRHVAKVANELLHKVTVKCVAYRRRSSCRHA